MRCGVEPCIVFHREVWISPVHFARLSQHVHFNISRSLEYRNVSSVKYHLHRAGIRLIPWSSCPRTPPTPPPPPQCCSGAVWCLRGSLMAGCGFMFSNNTKTPESVWCHRRQSKHTPSAGPGSDTPLGIKPDHLTTSLKWHAVIHAACHRSADVSAGNGVY